MIIVILSMNKKLIEEGDQLVLQFEKRAGLLPVIVQEHETGEVLMLGYANDEAFKKTIHSGMATFWSTSRGEIWTKGETSGDYLHVVHIRVDCDQDALLYQVRLEGKGVCHTKNIQRQSRKSCFYRKYNKQSQKLETIEP